MANTNLSLEERLAEFDRRKEELDKRWKELMVRSDNEWPSLETQDELEQIHKEYLRLSNLL